MTEFNRRSLMRGALGGAAVVVGIPTLDMFLDGNGKAYADGAKLPVRVGSYFWGLGLTPGRWVPQKLGAGYEITPELESLRGLEKKVSVMSGFRVQLDGRPNFQHWTGMGAIMSGIAPQKIGSFDLASWDTAAADSIGAGSRFRSIEATPFGKAGLSYSTRSGQSFNSPEISPMSLYQRLFGEGFQDPNSDTWKPSTDTMLRQSVLSAVTDQRKALMAHAGSADKQKLDQYYTSVREMEEQLGVQLQRPAKAEACLVPTAPQEKPVSRQIDVVTSNNIAMAKLMSMALACNQTKVFNVVFSPATSEVYLAGDASVYHLHTHDEAVDAKLGYQVISSKLAGLSFQGFGDFIREMDKIKEGDGTLLDNSVVLGYSDTGYAKIHSTDNIPMFIAGKAGGAHKAGQHIAVAGDPVSRVSLTVQRLAGMPVGEFGVGGMKTSKPITEIMA